MPQNHFHTLRDLLRYAVTCFQKEGISFGHGTQNAYDEAVYLLLHGLHLPLDNLDPFLDARLLPNEIDELLTLIHRRVQERLPAPYLTQEAWMHGLRFYIDQRALIPRSLIGEILQEGVTPWISDPNAIHEVLELCTGSGCLAIMAALTFPQAHIDAIDISPQALEVAIHNCADYQLEDRLTLFEGDLYQALPANLKKRYDLIIANPPYVNEESMQMLPSEYRAEPHIALAGGTDGMDIVRRILAKAKDYLATNGILIVEIGHEYEYAIAAFSELPLVWLPTSAGDKQVFLVHAYDL